ncbi:hypothetical protein Dsin_016134 [Dipteronia sinensis]|uniref:Uncharacterized protein n=1 Tax=Dipteronia sinensis TaxID=43782 RepID=A0AAE0ADA5_9ROSI|nr:hypothetical protein Dsin_016134 [Dipteronia sinensis]
MAWKRAWSRSGQSRVEDGSGSGHTDPTGLLAGEDEADVRMISWGSTRGEDGGELAGRLELGKLGFHGRFRRRINSGKTAGKRAGEVGSDAGPVRIRVGSRRPDGVACWRRRRDVSVRCGVKSAEAWGVSSVALTDLLRGCN